MDTEVGELNPLSSTAFCALPLPALVLEEPPAPTCLLVGDLPKAAAPDPGEPEVPAPPRPVLRPGDMFAIPFL